MFYTKCRIILASDSYFMLGAKSSGLVMSARRGHSANIWTGVCILEVDTLITK